MSAPESTAYQVNYKTPSGALLNIYASNAEELSEMLDAFEEIIPKIVAVEGLLVGAGNVAKSGAVAPPTQQTAAPAPSPAAPPAQADGPLCDHGEPMKFIPPGISKAGKPYRGFSVCARPREQQCAKKISA